MMMMRSQLTHGRITETSNLIRPELPDIVNPAVTHCVTCFDAFSLACRSPVSNGQIACFPLFQELSTEAVNPIIDASDRVVAAFEASAGRQGVDREHWQPHPLKP